MTRRMTASCLGSLILAVAGCSSSDVSGAAGQDREQLFDAQCEGTTIPDLPELEPVAPKAGTATVESAFGDVELPTHPSAALGMYTTDVDILVWLRYPLASAQPIRGDGGYSTFPCFFPYDELADLDTFANYPDFNYEGITQANPDFILNGLGYEKKVVDRLPNIAPTYSLDAFDRRSWMEHFEETAVALDRKQYFDEWKKLYDERVAEVKAKIDDPASIVVSPVGYYEGKANTGCYVGVECQVAEDLGLTILPVALSNDREGEALSAEQVGQLADADYLLMGKGLGDTGDKEHETTLAEAGKNALWRDLKAVKNDQIITYEFEMTFGSPSGQLAFLDVLEKALAD